MGERMLRRLLIIGERAVGVYLFTPDMDQVRQGMVAMPELMAATAIQWTPVFFATPGK